MTRTKNYSTQYFTCATLGTGIRPAHFFYFFFSKLLSIDILKNNEHFCIKIIYLTVGKAWCLCRWWRTVDVTRLEKDRVLERDRTGGWRGVGRAGNVLRSCLPPQGQDGPGNKFLNYCYILAYFQFKTFILYSKAITVFSTIASHFWDKKNLSKQNNRNTYHLQLKKRFCVASAL